MYTHIVRMGSLLVEGAGSVPHTHTTHTRSSPGISSSISAISEVDDVVSGST